MDSMPPFRNAWQYYYSSTKVVPLPEHPRAVLEMNKIKWNCWKNSFYFSGKAWFRNPQGVQKPTQSEPLVVVLKDKTVITDEEEIQGIKCEQLPGLHEFAPRAPIMAIPDRYPFRSIPAYSFPKFSKLPDSIRTIIWDYAVENDARIIELNHPDFDIFHRDNRPIRSESLLIKPRALLSTCCEARAQQIKALSKIFVGDYFLVINFKDDTIYFGPHCYWYRQVGWKPEGQKAWARKQEWDHWRVGQEKGIERLEKNPQNVNQFRRFSDNCHSFLCQDMYEIQRGQIQNVAFDLEFWEETGRRRRGGQRNLMAQFPKAKNFVLAAGDVGTSCEIKKIDKGTSIDMTYKPRRDEQEIAGPGLWYDGQIELVPGAVQAPHPREISGSRAPITMCVERGGLYKGHPSRFVSVPSKKGNKKNVQGKIAGKIDDESDDEEDFSYADYEENRKRDENDDADLVESVCMPDGGFEREIKELTWLNENTDETLYKKLAKKLAKFDPNKIPSPSPQSTDSNILQERLELDQPRTNSRKPSRNLASKVLKTPHHITTSSDGANVIEVLSSKKRGRVLSYLVRLQSQPEDPKCYISTEPMFENEACKALVVAFHSENPEADSKESTVRENTIEDGANVADIVGSEVRYNADLTYRVRWKDEPHADATPYKRTDPMFTRDSCKALLVQFHANNPDAADLETERMKKEEKARSIKEKKEAKNRLKHLIASREASNAKRLSAIPSIESGLSEALEEEHDNLKERGMASEGEPAPKRSMPSLPSEDAGTLSQVSHTQSNLPLLENNKKRAGWSEQEPTAKRSKLSPIARVTGPSVLLSNSQGHKASPQQGTSSSFPHGVPTLAGTVYGTQQANRPTATEGFSNPRQIRNPFSGNPTQNAQGYNTSNGVNNQKAQGFNNPNGFNNRNPQGFNGSNIRNNQNAQGLSTPNGFNNANVFSASSQLTSTFDPPYIPQSSPLLSSVPHQSEASQPSSTYSPQYTLQTYLRQTPQEPNGRFYISPSSSFTTSQSNMSSCLPHQVPQTQQPRETNARPYAPHSSPYAQHRGKVPLNSPPLTQQAQLPQESSIRPLQSSIYAPPPHFEQPRPRASALENPAQQHRVFNTHIQNRLTPACHSSPNIAEAHSAQNGAPQYQRRPPQETNPQHLQNNQVTAGHPPQSPDQHQH